MYKVRQVYIIFATFEIISMHKETLQESLHLYAVNSIYITALTQALGFQKTIFYIKVNHVAQISAILKQMPHPYPKRKKKTFKA